MANGLWLMDLCICFKLLALGFRLLCWSVFLFCVETADGHVAENGAGIGGEFLQAFGAELAAATVILAMGEGRRAAAGINAWLNK